jgi:hypothetical protein
MMLKRVTRISWSASGRGDAAQEDAAWEQVGGPFTNGLTIGDTRAVKRERERVCVCRCRCLRIGREK